MRRLAVAACSLDPPGGGAERSLCTLVNGLLVPGPAFKEEIEFRPLVTVDYKNFENLEPWKIESCHAHSGELTGLLDGQIRKQILKIPTESVWSGLAWRLRSKKTGLSEPHLYQHHLRRTNRRFSKMVSSWLDEMPTPPQLGITQLTWSAGAADAFQRKGIPYLIFIRDDVPFRFPEMFRSAIEGAICVCTAGEGLGRQVAEIFTMQRNANIPLAIDYGKRFTNLPHVKKWRQEGLVNRSDRQSPRFAIVGVTPEKGFKAYERLFPHLHKHWPEAHFDIYGSGHYVERLGIHPNATSHGHVPIEQAFAATDVHVIIGETAGTWGRVINEAGVFGVPTVTCGIGSQPEALGPGGVIVHDHHDIMEFSKVLRECWNRREELGKLAFEHAGVTDHRRAVSIFRALLEDLTI